MAKKSFDWKRKTSERIKDHTGGGWTVSENGKKTRLRVRANGKHKDYPLKLEFCSENWKDIARHVEAIFDLVQGGDHDVASAIRELERPATSATEVGAGFDWSALLTKYEQHARTNNTKIGDATWKQYMRDLTVALELLESGRVKTTFELIDQVQIERGLKTKTKARQEAITHVGGFMAYCHRFHKTPTCWAPLSKEDKEDLMPEKHDPQKSITLSDRQILELVDYIKDESWQNLVMVLAAYGLRPHELGCLSVRVNDEGEEQLWCSYEKKAGKGKTAPRWLTPIYPCDDDGIPANWNLLHRFKEGTLVFPSLTDKSHVGQYLGRDCRVFRTWKEEAAEVKQKLTPYCFRHSYSARGHSTGLPSSVMAFLMGHSLETHNREYKHLQKDSMQALLKKCLGTAVPVAV